MDSDIKFYISNKSARVSAEAFILGANKLLKILIEVETALSDKDKAMLDWEIHDLHKSSAAIEFAAISKELLPYSGYDVANKVINGLRLLEKEARRPKYFTDDALAAAKDLAFLVGKKTEKVTISSKNNVIDLTLHVAANVNKILEPPTEENGTIEGTLKMLSTAKNWYFNVYDSVTGVAVSCYFDEELLLKAATSINRRVSVSGLISYNVEGYPKSIRQISEFTILPLDDELPTINDIVKHHFRLGGGLSLNEFMERRHYGRE